MMCGHYMSAPTKMIGSLASLMGNQIGDGLSILDHIPCNGE